MKKLFYLVVLPLFILGIYSCKEDPVTPPPPVEPPDYRKINLSIEDVSCTKVWLKISLDSIVLPAEINLELNNTDWIINLFQRDTVLIFDSLQPNQNYILKAVLEADSTIKVEQNFNTLDITNPVYTWQTWEFGEYGHSILWDIKIINENNIWAAGEIYMKDSLGNDDFNAYNAIHWDGNKWEMFRIPFYSACGGTGTGYYTIRSIHVFSENEIWFCLDGDQIVKFSNNKFSEPICIPIRFPIFAIWGISTNNVYIVGLNGNIVHYNGTSWEKIESGTTIQLHDVYGSPQGEVIYACGSTNSGGETVFLKIENNKVTKLYEGDSFNLINDRYVGNLNSVWTKNKYQTYYLNPGWGIINSQDAYCDSLNPQVIVDNIDIYMHKLRGTDHNNIYLAGEHGILGHYNGITYKIIYNRGIIGLRFLNIDTKDKILGSSGWNNYSPAFSTAFIVLGRTN